MKKNILFIFLFLITTSKVAAIVFDGDYIIDKPLKENLCAITFDDGPTRYTPYLLDLLEQYNIKATFFMLGKNAELYKDIVKRAINEGHEVESHSYSHPNLKRLSIEKITEEIKRTKDILISLGANPKYFRPPYGIYDDNVLNILKDHDLSLILWSVDSKDWKRLPIDYASLLNTKGFSYQKGDLRGIFLFHDNHKKTVEDLPRIIRDLRAGGCQRFVTVSEYLEDILDPQEHLMAMFPAGSTPIPLARTSTPWSEENKNLVSREPVFEVFISKRSH